jgi:hypothetical protein
MKIIDQTPFQDENGEINFVNRIQAALKYGLSWYDNIQAQKPVIAILNRVLEKGFVLLRNQQLGASGITVPIIVIGTPGIYVMDVTPLKGFYRARGDEWGTVSNGVFQPAPINSLKRISQLAQVLEKFLERQGAKLTEPVESALLAADPALHIDSVRPVARVVMRDAIERFAAGLLSARPVYSAAAINELAERIVKPRSAQGQEQPEAVPENDPFAVKDETPFPATESSRMQAILNAPQSDTLIESSAQPGMEFAFEDEDTAAREAEAREAAAREPTVLVSNPLPAQAGGKRRRAAPAQRRIFGMTVVQILILLGIFACGFASLAAIIGYAYLTYYATP